jgi:hypothetical protein
MTNMQHRHASRQFLTANVHNPRVERITRHDSNMLAVTLGNNELHGHVTVFMTDADWVALVGAVADWLAAERGSTAEKTTGALHCDDCAYIAGSSAWLARHYMTRHGVSSADAYARVEK